MTIKSFKTGGRNDIFFLKKISNFPKKSLPPAKFFQKKAGKYARFRGSKIGDF